MRVNTQDIIGQRYGMLTVVEYKGFIDGRHIYKCLCDCGTEKSVRRSNLIYGNTTSCGCKRNPVSTINHADIIGKRFGQLYVKEYLGNKGGAKYLCHCDCGKDAVVPRKQLLNGRSVTCGQCFSIEREGDHWRYYDYNKKSFIFDDCDLQTVESHRWNVDALGYAVTSDRKTTSQLTRLIMTPDKKHYVDHINGDPSDNRRANLRIATYQENQRNMVLPKHNTSGYKGVSFMPDRNKYRAYISLNDRALHLGYFMEAEEAARTYDRAARFFFGEFSCLNFPLAGEQGCRRLAT